MSNYVTIYTMDGKETIVYNLLKELAHTLIPLGFQRINKSTIVSLQHIQRIQGNELYLTGIAEPFPIGKPYKDDLLRSISL